MTRGRPSTREVHQSRLAKRTRARLTHEMPVQATVTALEAGWGRKKRWEALGDGLVPNAHHDAKQPWPAEKSAEPTACLSVATLCTWYGLRCRGACPQGHSQPRGGKPSMSATSSILFNF